MGCFLPGFLVYFRKGKNNEGDLVLHLTWTGLRGRRRETSLLLIVLVLAFLLSSALAIVLPSTRAELQLQREKSYGKWQLMLYGEDPEICAALKTAA